MAASIVPIIVSTVPSIHVLMVASTLWIPVRKSSMSAFVANVGRTLSKRVSRAVSRSLISPLLPPRRLCQTFEGEVHCYLCQRHKRGVNVDQPFTMLSSQNSRHPHMEQRTSCNVYILP